MSAQIFLYDLEVTINPLINISNTIYPFYNSSPRISDDNVVWVGNDDGDYESDIYFYNGSTRTTTQLSNNPDYDDASPQISGDNVVWVGLNGFYYYNLEIYFYNGGVPIPLTDNNYWEVEPQISGNNVVWWGDDSSGNDKEIYFYNASETLSTPTQLTTNDYDDHGPQISGNNIVWFGYDGNDNEIYFYNASETLSTPTQLTTNDYDDYGPQISGSNVVWQGHDGNDYEIYFYNGTTTTQLTDNGYPDESPQISGNNVVWYGYGNLAEPDVYWSDPEIFLYDGSQVIQVTNNDYNDYGPKISGDNVVWVGYDDHGDFTGDNDICRYNISSRTTINLSEPGGEEDYVDEFEPQISGNKVVWVRVVNDPPIANDDTLGGKFPPNTTTTILKWELLGNDIDENLGEAKIEVVSSDTATVQLNSDGHIVFTPKIGLSYPNTATFSYTIEDSFGAVSAPATVTVNLGALVKGTNRANTLFGTELADWIEGFGGDDLLQGLDSDDLLLGGTGRDVLKGGGGRDRLVGGADADAYIGVSYEDTIVLEHFNDSLLKIPDLIEATDSTLNIDVPDKPNSISIPWDSARCLLTPSLREKDIKNTLERYNSDFGKLGAEFFQYIDKLGTTQTFLAIDDGNGTFSAFSDSIIEVRGNCYGASIF